MFGKIFKSINKFLFGGLFDAPKVAPAPTAPTKESSVEIAQARAEERDRLRKARGRNSTLLGGSVGDQSGTKRLLGS